jgi:hypothetical protein
MKKAGESTRDMAFKRYCLRVVIGLGAGLVLWLLAKYGLKAGMAWGIGGIVVVAIVMKFITTIAEDSMKTVRKKEKRAIRGAVAEEKVGAILDTLPKAEYRVMHDVRSPYGNIDHVVVTKNGNVFLIETKAHGGKVSLSGDNLLINGHAPEKNFIRQTTNNAYWLKGEVKRLTGSDVWVNSILVFTNAFVPTLPQIKGIQIIGQRSLSQVIQRGNSLRNSMNLWNHLLLFEAMR